MMQVEFASLIIINKCDLISSENLRRLKQTIRSLNADAKILEAVNCNVPLQEVVGSRGFDFERVSASPSWLQAINSDEEKM